MAKAIRHRFLSALTALSICATFALLGDSMSPSPASAWTEPERSQPMANAVRVENISNADQEIAPGSGFIPPGGHADYSLETYREKHERYAKARVEANPPLLKLTEFDSPEIERRDADLQKLADDDRKAQEERAAAELLAEAEKKATEQKQADDARLAAEQKENEARQLAEKQAADEQRQQAESSSGGSGHKRGR